MNINNLPKTEQDTLDNLLSKINLKSQKNETTNFLNALEQKLLESLIHYNYSYSVEFFGGHKNCERKKARILKINSYTPDYNIVCLSASFNDKFNTIYHKDVLGAILNLGISYDRIGDIFIEKNKIYIFVCRSIFEYVKMNFTRIAKVKLNFEEVEEYMIDIPDKKYELVEIVVPSFRIDVIVSKLTNTSRTKAKEFFEKEFIKINHSIVNDGAKNCEEDDLLSIRRYGRYYFSSSKQNNKTGKYRLTFKKLI